MEVDVLTTIISNVGFPIACVIAMFYMWNKEREAHKEETDRLAEAINNNTIVMQQVLNKLGG
jgi:hypothetical protein